MCKAQKYQKDDKDRQLIYVDIFVGPGMALQASLAQT